MAATNSGLGALGRESILVLRYPPDLSQRDCDLLDRDEKFLGSVVRVEGKTSRSLLGPFGLANLRCQTFEIRDGSGRCLHRIKGPSSKHEATLIVADPRGSEVGAIRRPDLGFFGPLALGLGKRAYDLEGGGQRLGSMTRRFMALGARIYDTSGNQIARLSHSQTWAWRRSHYIIQFFEPLHEVLRVLAIATAVWVRSTARHAAT